MNNEKNQNSVLLFSVKNTLYMIPIEHFNFIEIMPKQITVIPNAPYYSPGICRYADETDFAVTHMWEYCWGFIIASVNTLLSAYFYSTKRSKQAIILNTVRSLIFNTAVITLLPKIFGKIIIWHTFGIYEIFVMLVAIILLKISERNGIIYK